MFYLRVFSTGVYRNCKVKHYFFWKLFGNDTVLVCKLYLSGLQVKTLILDMSEILNNLYIDRLTLVAFAKYILSQIWSHIFGTILLDTFWRLWKLLLFEEKYF